MTTKSSRPRDPNQLAKMIVDIATGEVADPTSEEKRNPQPKKGQAGGLKGGAARATVLTAAQRSDVARIAAAARWGKAGKRVKD
jgi:hypothetical protein